MDIVRFIRNLMQQDRVLVQQMRHTHLQEQFNCHMVSLHMVTTPIQHGPTTPEGLDVIWEHQISPILRHGIVALMFIHGVMSPAVVHQTHQLDIKLVMME